MSQEDRTGLCGIFEQIREQCRKFEERYDVVDDNPEVNKIWGLATAGMSMLRDSPNPPAVIGCPDECSLPDYCCS